MILTLKQLVEIIDPPDAVLVFGSGSSIPSKAPDSKAIIAHLVKRFGITAAGFNLAETASLVEQKTSRADLILGLRELFPPSLKPTGGLLNLPLYKWRSIFTTNYEDLIEQTYSRREIPLLVYTSNFDFRGGQDPTTAKLYKLHGTIGKDVSDGDKSRIIISEADYDQTVDYRDFLYGRLASDLAGARVIIIGHSLTDPEIRDVINRTATINAKADNGGKITLLLYTEDRERASLFERRGIDVCFAGIDEFFAALTERKFGDVAPKSGDSPLDDEPSLAPVTVDVDHASDPRRAIPAQCSTAGPPLTLTC